MARTFDLVAIPLVLAAATGAVALSRSFAPKPAQTAAPATAQVAFSGPRSQVRRTQSLRSVGLTEPNTGRYIGSVVEDCSGPKAQVWVYLAAAYELHSKESLLIQESAHEQPAVWVSAGGSDFDVIRFRGPSEIGCLSGDVVLTLTRGGKLGTLYLVLGQGTI